MKLFHYSLEAKRVIVDSEYEELRNAGTVDLYKIVSCYKIAVWGSLRKGDIGYRKFHEFFVNQEPEYEEIENYHKVKHDSRYTVEYCPNAVMDVQIFYVYPDGLEILERVRSGIFNLVELEDGTIIYTKGNGFQKSS